MKSIPLWCVHSQWRRSLKKRSVLCQRMNVLFDAVQGFIKVIFAVAFINKEIPYSIIAWLSKQLEYSK